VEVEDKQPKVTKLTARTLFYKSLHYRLFIISLILIGCTIALIILKPWSNNSRLSRKVQTLTTSYHSCSDGIQQLGSVVNPRFAQDTSYSRPVREKVLGYIVNCEFAAGHSAQALAYANQLESLYLRDGKGGARNYAQWQHTIQFIKTYNQG
jgi:hypothetical protein